MSSNNNLFKLRGNYVSLLSTSDHRHMESVVNKSIIMVLEYCAALYSRIMGIAGSMHSDYFHGAFPSILSFNSSDILQFLQCFYKINCCL